MNVSCALLASIVVVATGCAHRTTVTRRVDDRFVVGPYVPPSSWESAFVETFDERRSPVAGRTLAAALAAGEVEHARAIALGLSSSHDPRIVELVVRAFVRSDDAPSLEALVASHADDAAFVASMAWLADSLSPGLAAAIARGLATSPPHRSRAALALALVGRRDEARQALDEARPTTLDDRLALAEAARLVGDPGRGLTLAREAYAAGASTRARAIEARCLRDLGRDEEARAVESALDPGSAGALAAGFTAL